MKTFWMLWAVGLSTQAMAGTAEQQEWHEYCDMTVRVKVDGWEALKEEQAVSIPINKDTLECKHEIRTDFSGVRKTFAIAYLTKTALAPISVALNHTGADVHIFRGKGEISEVDACQRVAELLERSAMRGGTLKAKVTRTVVRQDWTSSKNTDVRTIEQLSIALDANTDIPFRASQDMYVRGKYCSKKPLP